MPANISQFASTGLHSIQIGARGATGFFAGFGNLTAADTGDVSGMRRVYGAVTAPSPSEGINRVRNRGEDGYITARVFAAEPQDFDLEFEAADLDVETFLIGGIPYVLGDWDAGLGGSSTRNYQDTVVLLSAESTSMESATRGQSGYENLLIMSSKFVPRPGGFAFQAANSNVYSGTPEKVEVAPWGLTLDAMSERTDGMTYRVFTTNPLTLVCAVADGTTVEWDLPVKPVSAGKTKCFNFTTGLAMTVSAVNTTTDTATNSAAGTSGDILVFLLETTDL